MQGILYDARWIGPHGIGRFADEVSKQLTSLVHYTDKRPPWHPADPFLLSAVIRSRKPKVFFSPGYNSPAISCGPFVFTLHDLHHLRVPEDSTAVKRAYYRYFIRPACHRAEFVLTVSEFSKREIVEWAEVSDRKVIVAGNGIGPPFELAGPKWDPGFPYLLYVGSGKPNKNLPRLLQAYALAGVARDLRLIVVGAEGPALEAEIERLGIRDSVIFRACTSDKELATIYRAAVAFLFPSLYEGFGLPPLEAMACGTPVLASNTTATPEILGDAGLLVDPYCVDEIAAGIRELAGDSGLRAELVQKGIVRAAQYPWAEAARKTSEVLEMAACA